MCLGHFFFFLAPFVPPVIGLWPVKKDIVIDNYGLVLTSTCFLLTFDHLYCLLHQREFLLQHKLENTSENSSIHFLAFWGHKQIISFLVLIPGLALTIHYSQVCQCLPNKVSSNPGMKKYWFSRVLHQVFSQIVFWKLKSGFKLGATIIKLRLKSTYTKVSQILSVRPINRFFLN